MTASLGFLGLVVDDIAAATKFYTETLGFKLNTAESIPNFFSQFETEGGADFALVNGFGDAPSVTQRFDAGLMVADIDATFAEWQAKGAEMVTEVTAMPFGRTFLCCTPDNHILRVWTPASVQ